MEALANSGDTIINSKSSAYCCFSVSSVPGAGAGARKAKASQLKKVKKQTTFFLVVLGIAVGYKTIIAALPEYMDASSPVCCSLSG